MTSMGPTEHRTLWQHGCGLLRRVNYELHLVQHGLAGLAPRQPWVRLPLVSLSLSVVWGLYWCVYPALVLVTLLALPLAPIERKLRSTS